MTQTKIKYKILSKDEMSQIWSEIDNEGLGYWVQNYSVSLKGTQYELAAKMAKKYLDKLDDMYHSFEKFNIEE